MVEVIEQLGCVFNVRTEPIVFEESAEGTMLVGAAECKARIIPLHYGLMNPNTVCFNKIYQFVLKKWKKNYTIL